MDARPLYTVARLWSLAVAVGREFVGEMFAAGLKNEGDGFEEEQVDGEAEDPLELQAGRVTAQGWGNRMGVRLAGRAGRRSLAVLNSSLLD